MNKPGEWLVQYTLCSTESIVAVGKYPNKKMAIAAAYLALATHIDECGGEIGTYSITSPFSLGDEDDLEINVILTYDDDISRLVINCTLTKILDDDHELWQ